MTSNTDKCIDDTEKEVTEDCANNSDNGLSLSIILEQLFYSALLSLALSEGNFKVARQESFRNSLNSGNFEAGKGSTHIGNFEFSNDHILRLS